MSALFVYYPVIPRRLTIRVTYSNLYIGRENLYGSNIRNVIYAV